MDAARLARLRLARTPRIGPFTYRQLMGRFGDAASALEALPDLVRRGGGMALIPPARGAVEREVQAAERLGARYVFADEPDYPEWLAQADIAPPALLWRGDLSLANGLCVAMVGARNASAAACRFARDLARDLAQDRAVIVSGLARGIDTAAHMGALSIGRGTTIGVIASGMDIYFPPENRDLQDRVAAEGLLLSEYPPGTEPRARQFPHRNRIIAGLSRGTVVVEAAPRSGSLITARLANEMGREVMAVPGSPLDPRAQGCNQLIRQGATLIQDAQHVLEAIGPLGGGMVRQPQHQMLFDTDTQLPTASPEPGEDARSRLADLLSLTPVAMDELIRQSGLDTPAAMTIIMELELAGRALRHPGGGISLNSPLDGGGDASPPSRAHI